MKYMMRQLGPTVAVLGLLVSPAHAGLVVFSAFDNAAGPTDPRPLSNAAAASFDAAAAAIGPASTITFESAPVGSFHNLTVAPGVSINGTDAAGVDQTIRNTSNFPTNPALDGYNTTAGGANFVEMVAGNLVFTFSNPTQFFGAYFTGVQTTFFTDTITFFDGTSQSITIPGSVSAGGVAFTGFTDAGALISSIKVTAGTVGPGGAGDFIGVDDVRFQTGPSTAPVPEPSTIISAGMAVIMGLGYVVRRRKLIA